VSVTQPASVSPVPGQPVHHDACPLCGAPLHPEQEWCLKCGAAARTRLAATPNWKGPVIALVLVIAVSLGVLAAALIKLAGESSSSSTGTSAAATLPAATQPAVVTEATVPAPTVSTAAVSPAPGGVAAGTQATTTRPPAFGLSAAAAAGAVGSRTSPVTGLPTGAPGSTTLQARRRKTALK
jgi:hypothetical protein